ncbi:cryptochrome/photolyase family protein [Lacisediminihabitans changchengi]|uniref:Deoxyribodipyrimidine photo-lyase n=1 Tax=Lacisediminihabitans changchengi TaxID=2787634 RepID=A0A934W556_9MICO|nr:deoxyribodipyrimidine photo-lyase [Lacisediminihabitans changchengi]MBK4348979.1 deoxyribodipyrimidine photo-lyase [Lacisediminihabitans changchengi]
MTTSSSPSIVWLRDDLRLADNPAIRAAVDRGEPIVVLYLLDEESRGIRPIGAASRWWLHHSLTALGDSIAERGGTFVLRRGAAAEALPKLVDEVGAGAVFWNRRYGGTREVDAALKTSLRESGLEAQSFQANLMHEPWTVTTGSGTPFKVFTPFWKACLEQGEPRASLPTPQTLEGVTGVDSDDLADWALLPTHPDWAGGIAEAWVPGEHGAHERLEQFCGDGLEDYAAGRDEPSQDATSRLSPYLRFGEISPFQIWDRVQRGQLSPAARRNAPKFLREVGWREFNYNILFHFPQLQTDNFRPEFDAFPWSKPRQEVLEAWQQGRTGIPLVDAGMRELWQTGYMHNRVRMVVASLLIKNLLIDWRVGEAWFWDCLVDADEANNPANWQWVAGSGADAAPYFRVFNPMLQADKFDRHGEYQRRYIPELGTDDYPSPIVDLKESRAEALEAYDHLKNAQLPAG